MNGLVKQVGSEFLLNAQGLGDQTGPDIAGLSNGGFVAVWTTADTSQDGSSSAIKAQLFGSAGTRAGAEFLVNSESTDVQFSPTVTALVNGGFVVSWASGDSTQDGDAYSIKAQIFSPSGATVGGEFLVNTISEDSQTYPQAIALSNGGFVIGWRTIETYQDVMGPFKAQVFDAIGQKTGNEFLIGTQSGRINNYEFAAFSDGKFLAVYSSHSTDVDGGKTRAQLFDSSGGKVGAEIMVDATGGDWPSVAVLENGSFVVTWWTGLVAADGSGTAIKGQIFDRDGQKIGSEFLVNTEAKGFQDDPSVASLANGGFIVSWHTDDDAQDGSGRAIKAQVFDSAGNKVDSEFLVNSSGGGNQSTPVTATYSDGHSFVVAWRTDDLTQDGSGTAIKAQRFTFQAQEPPVDPEPGAGIKLGGEFVVNTQDENDQTLPTVTGLAGGGFVISWATYDPTQDGTGTAIKAQVYNAVGGKVGSEFLVNTQAADHQDDPTITSLSNGGFVISWTTWDAAQDGNLTAIKAQVFDAAGIKVGSEFLVNTQAAEYQAYPAITGLKNGGFVASWTTWDPAQDGNALAIKAQVFNATGGKVGSEFLVNTENFGDQSDATITGLANGGFVVSWHTTDVAQDGSSSAIKAQVFNATGAKVGSEFLANTQGADSQTYPAVTELLGGGFVISWSTRDATQDGDSWAVKAQVFNSTGGKVGSEFIVNTEGAGEQGGSIIVGLSDGGFVVAWVTDDPAQDGDGTAIKAQVFDAVGGKVGGEFLVNTVTANNQVVPALAALADGSFVVTWTNGDPAVEGDAVIKAQIFTLQTPNSTPVVDWQLFTTEGFVGEIGGNGLVFGTNGFDDITVVDGQGTTRFDASFNRGGDIVRLDGAANDWRIGFKGSNAVLTDGDSTIEVPIGVNGMALVFDDGARTLRYDSTVGAPKIGSQTITGSLELITAASSSQPLPGEVNSDAVASLLLASDTTTIAGGDLTIFGTNGQEDIHILHGEVTFDGSFNRGGDRIAVEEDASDFTAVLIGSSVFLDSEQTDLLIPVGTVGATIGFADGDRVVRYDTSLGTVLIGDTQIGISPIALPDFV